MNSTVAFYIVINEIDLMCIPLGHSSPLRKIIAVEYLCCGGRTIPSILAFSENLRTFKLNRRPGWCNERAFAWGSDGCGFDPQPRHTKSRKNMVQVAPLLTLGIER